MKKLTLDQTWEECLRMWEWIAEQIEFYGKLVALNKKRVVLYNLEKNELWCYDKWGFPCSLPTSDVYSFTGENLFKDNLLDF